MNIKSVRGLLVDGTLIPINTDIIVITKDGDLYEGKLGETNDIAFILDREKNFINFGFDEIQSIDIIPDMTLINEIDTTDEIKEIEKSLGFDKIEPIFVTSSEVTTKMYDEERFRQWYAEEMIKLWEECKDE